MKTLLTALFLVFLVPVPGQRSIRGVVLDSRGEPLAYASVFLEGSYEGSVSDSSGFFRLETDHQGQLQVTLSFIGYESVSASIPEGIEDTSIRVVLRRSTRDLNAVSVTAGTFTASDQKQSAILSPYDITTTASAMGDIYGAFATMPGSQVVGEQGMLFVRGGEARETRSYMDGMYIQSPYLAKQPDLPTRGRFSPLLFSETIFSTGGYSAEYGQALSSVVDMSTNGLEEVNKASLALMSVGGSGSFARSFERSSLAMTAMYTHSGLHNRIFRQEVDWISHPSLGDLSLMYRHRLGKEGMFKAFAALNGSSMEMNYDNFREGRTDYLKMIERNLLLHATFSSPLGKKWSLSGGLGRTMDLEDLVYRSDPIQTRKQADQARLSASWEPYEGLKWRSGITLLREQYGRSIRIDSSFHLGLELFQAGLFSEADLLITRWLALRGGLRGEYLSFGGTWSLSPRISAAIKAGAFSQVSLAWGRYSQLPAYEQLVMAPQLQEEKAAHLILNFQWRRNKRMLRVEAYSKQYSQLLKYEQALDPDPGNYSNEGLGYARGVDFFWRDRKSIPGLDYWISYSFLDTERDYRDYPGMAVPDFASAHNLSVVTKYFIRPIRTFAGITWAFASPRPYHDPNGSGFMNGRTPCYQDLSLGLTYLTSLAGRQVVLHLNMNNVAGTRNIYGYQFRSEPDPSGHYVSKALTASTGRQAVFVILISF